MSGFLFSKKNVSRAVLFGFLTSVMLSFQNCGNGFQVQNLSEMTDLASLAVPEIVFKESPEIINTAMYNIQFDITGSNSIKSVSCQLNANPPTDCMSAKSVILNNLVDGDYIMKVSVETTYGVKAEALKLFRKDGTLPAVAFSTQPSNPTNQTTANFTFTASDNLSGVDKLECSIDAGAFAACVSPKAIPVIAGDHTLIVRATDKAGNIGMSTYAWKVDLSVPTVVISAGPAAITNATNASFTFSGAGIVSYECKLDAGAFTACVSPQAYNAISAGNHNVLVHGKNAAGTLSADTKYSWKVDLVAPAVPTLMANVLAFTNSTNVSFNFSSVDVDSAVASFRCKLDNVDRGACTSPYSLAVAPNAAHNFQVYATDQAGNQSAVAAFNWTVDQTAPIINLTSKPLPQADINVSFSFSATDSLTGISTLQCVLRAVGDVTTAFENCANGTKAYTNLVPGNYNFLLKATDKAGNNSDLTYPFTVLKPYSGLSAQKVATGDNFTCYIDDGALKCFGINTRGELGDGSTVSKSNPITLFSSGVTEVKAYQYNACAIVNGAVYCWGEAYAANAGSGSTPKLMISSGATAIAVAVTSCAIVNGSVQCWGGDGSQFATSVLGNGTTNKSATPITIINSGATAIVSANSGSCAVVSGALYCWGKIEPYSPAPVDLVPKVVFPSGVKDVALGDSNICAIMTNDTRCWGTSFYANGNSTPAQPQILPFADQKLSLSIGANCGLDASGVLSCFGNNDFGQIGNGKFDRTSKFEPILTGVSQVSTSYTHTCAIYKSQLRCWGSQAWGQLGNNIVATKLTPQLVKRGVDSVFTDKSGKLSSGYEGSYLRYPMTCANMKVGDISCWGSLNVNSSNPPQDLDHLIVSDAGYVFTNSYGFTYHRGSFTLKRGVRIDIGLNGLSARLVGKTLTSNYAFIDTIVSNNALSFDVGDRYGCAVLDDGTVGCWGENNYGQLGDGTRTNSPTKIVKANGIAGATQVATSWYTSCAIVSGGTVKCWGNAYNFAADGSPITVVASGAVKIKASFNNICALLDTGRITCFFGTYNASPIPVAGITDFDIVDTYPDALGRINLNMCVIANGALTCRGINDRGQIGNGTTNKTEVLATVIPSGVTSVMISGDHACAVANSDLYCWGSNNDDQLGLQDVNPFKPTP